MPLKLSVGLQKKVGQPDYGSLGASCHVEIELDGSLLQNDPQSFQQRASQAFVACRQAVSDELARNQSNGTGNGHSQPANGSAPGNGTANGNAAQNSSGGNGRPATASQVRAIKAIAGRQRLDLPQLLGNRFRINKPEDLSLSDASALIDELKGSENGNGNRR